MVRSPVEICLGTRPNQAAKSRPLENTSPAPIAATIALEMIGPIPGTLISRSQPASWRAIASISFDGRSMGARRAGAISGQIFNNAHHEWRQNVEWFGQATRKLSAQEAQSLPNGKATFQ